MRFRESDVIRRVVITREVVVAAADARSRKRTEPLAAEVHPAAADEHTVPRREHVVQAHVVLAPQPRVCGIGQVIATRRLLEIRCGPEIQQPRCNRIPSVARDGVSWKRSVVTGSLTTTTLGSKIPSRSPSAGTVSRRFSVGVHAADFKAGEIERATFADGPAERESELVLLERVRVRFAVTRAIEVVEGVARVEDVIAEEFVRRAVDDVGSRFDADVDHGSGAAPELGGVVARLNLEFLDRVDVRHQDLRLPILDAHHLRVVVDAVEQEAVLDRPLPMAVETRLPLNVAERGQHSCGERRQLRKVPAVHRQLTDLRSADRVRQSRRVGLEERSRTSHRNRIV